MFSHPSQVRPNPEVHPSQIPEYYTGHTNCQDSWYNPHQYGYHEVVGHHFHPPQIIRPESAPIRHTAHHPIVEHERCFSGSPSPGGHQQMMRYIPLENAQAAYHTAHTVHQYPNRPVSNSTVSLSRRAVPAEKPRSWMISPMMVSPLPPTSVSNPSQSAKGDDDLSLDIAEQYFHLDEGELSFHSGSDASIELTASSGTASRHSGSAETATTWPAGLSASGSSTSLPPHASKVILKATLRSLNKRKEATQHWTDRASRSRSRSRSCTRKPPSDFQPQSLMDLLDQHVLQKWARREQDSRTLQNLMRSADDRVRQLAWNEISPDFVDLSCHTVGNYVIQKFLEFGAGELRDSIIDLLTHNLMRLCRDNFGCRVVQKAIEVTTFPVRKSLLNHLSESDLAILVGCQHGNHVVQKFVMELPADELGPFYNVFHGRVVGHCVQMYACRVVQRLYVHATPAFRNQMTEDILEHCIRLSKDQWGNYVVQFVIENGKPSVVKRIVNMLLQDFEALSFHKLASNVVEKCVEFASPSSVDLFVKALLTRSNDDLVDFVTDDYGNYVVQTLIDRGHFRQAAHKITRRLKKYSLAQTVKMSTAGRRVTAKLEEKSNEFQKKTRSQKGNSSSWR